MAAAWAGSAAKSVMAFAGSAVTAIGSYLAATAMAVAGSVASAAAVAAAWLAPLAPFLLLGAAIAGVAAVAYSFRNTIAGAFSGLGDLIGQASSAIESTFSKVVSDASVVFSDLATTATTTFSGIYEAIADGDLAGAMDILWAGLVAGWLRGSEALMSYVDPWIGLFQNTFTALGAGIYKTWDTIWLNLSNAFNTFSAVLLGALDNLFNGIAATFDGIESTARKAMNLASKAANPFMDLAAANAEVDAEMQQRADARAGARPGVDARARQAADDNARATAQRDERAAAIDANTQAAADAREAADRQRADERRAATQEAESTVAGKGKGKREARARNDQFTRLLSDIENATSIDQLRDLYGEFDALNANGRLSAVQASTIEAALEDAQERVTRNLVNAQSAAAQGAAQRAARAGAMAAGQDAAQSKAEVAGTFSAMAAEGMGFGSNLAERALKAAERTANATEQMAAEGGPRAAE
jgi:hypothetical protein